MKLNNNAIYEFIDDTTNDALINKSLKKDVKGNYFTILKKHNLIYLTRLIGLALFGTTVYLSIKGYNNILRNCLMVCLTLVLFYNLYLSKTKIVITNKNLIMLGFNSKKVSINTLRTVASINPPKFKHNVLLLYTYGKPIKINFNNYKNGSLFAKLILHKLTHKEIDFREYKALELLSTKNMKRTNNSGLMIINFIIPAIILYLCLSGHISKISLFLFCGGKLGVICGTLYSLLLTNIIKIILISISLIFSLYCVYISIKHDKKYRTAIKVVNKNNVKIYKKRDTRLVTPITLLMLIMFTLLNLAIISNDKPFTTIKYCIYDINYYYNNNFKIEKTTLNLNMASSSPIHKHLSSKSKNNLCYRFNSSLYYIPKTRNVDIKKSDHTYMVYYLPNTKLIVSTKCIN